MNVVYLRLLVILVSLLENDRDTGLFADLLPRARAARRPAGRDPLRRAAGARRRGRRGPRAVPLRLPAPDGGGDRGLAARGASGRRARLAGDPARCREEYADAAPILRVQALSLVPVFVAQALHARARLAATAAERRGRQRTRACGRARARPGSHPGFRDDGCGGGRGGDRVDPGRGAARRPAPARACGARRGLGFVWRPLVAAAAGAVPPVVLDRPRGWIEGADRRGRSSSSSRSLVQGGAGRGHAGAARAAPGADVTRPRVVLLRGHSANPGARRLGAVARPLRRRRRRHRPEPLRRLRARAGAGRGADTARPAAARPARRPRRAPSGRPLPRAGAGARGRRPRPLGGARLVVLDRACGAEGAARVPARADGLGDDPAPRPLPRPGARTARPRRQAGSARRRRPLPGHDRARPARAAAEGAAAERIVVAPPGIDTARFASGRASGRRGTSSSRPAGSSGRRATTT